MNFHGYVLLLLQSLAVIADDDLEHRTHLLVAGGFSSSTFFVGTDDVEVLSLASSSQSCQKPPNLPAPLTGAAGTNLDGVPTLCGGLDGFDQSDECYQMREGAWETSSRGLSAPRTNGASWRHGIYWAISGGTSTWHSVEDGTETDEGDGTIRFSDAAYKNLEDAVSGHSMVRYTREPTQLEIDALNGTVVWVEEHLVMGGQNTEGTEFFNDVIIFYNTNRHPKDGNPNTIARSYAFAGIVENEEGQQEIVFAGGRGEGNDFLASTEIYNTVSKSWRFGQDLPVPVRGGASVQYDGSFLCVGGHSSSGPVGTILRYDVGTEGWDVMEQTLQTPRSYHVAFLVDADLC